MKLYATIKNEKGKIEGVGGNESIEVNLSVGNKTLAYIRVLPPDEENPNGILIYNFYDVDGYDIDAAGIMEKRDTNIPHVHSSRWSA